MDAVRRFGSLARQYAAESGDPLLTGWVAGLRSRIAFDNGQYAKAADVAAQARAHAHPGQRARLAAYEAEALGAAGKEAAARAALVEMRDQSPRAMRWTDGDQMIFTAVSLSHLRDREPAAELAREYAAGDDNDLEGIGWAHAAIGNALLVEDRPDPGQAAHEGLLALGSTLSPNMSVLRRVSGLHTDLRRRWPDVAEVAELGEALTTARAELAS